MAMTCMPSVSDGGGFPVMTFDSMPLWEGLQEKPGIRRTLPFSLTAKIGSPIAQHAQKKIVNDIVGAYQSESYNFLTAPPGTSRWADSRGERSVKAVADAVDTGYPKNILEIGGGNTWVARRLVERYDPSSYTLVDPSAHDSEERVEVIRDYFPSQQLADRQFDLVLGFSVLEHVPDVKCFLRNIRKQLTDGGKVVLIYPDCESQLRRGDLNSLLHEHFSYFTKNSTLWMAAATGFEVISLCSKDDIFTLVLEAGCASIGDVENLDESKMLLHSSVQFNSLLTTTAGTIQRYLEDGQNVAFHGATQGLNSFLAMTKLGQYRNIHLYDGDDSKEGLYLPACSTPIMSPMDISYEKNSLVVISALSYRDQIAEFAMGRAGINPARLLPLDGGL